MNYTQPILSIPQARNFESALFAQSPEASWNAMSAAGKAIAQGIRRDFLELAPYPEAPRILLLAGKGHNAGDAFLAAADLLGATGGQIHVVFVYGRELKPQTQRALEVLQAAAGDRLQLFDWTDHTPAEHLDDQYDICIDGMLGMQFNPPVASPGDAVIRWVNELHEEILFRAAIDLPSGVGETVCRSVFRADFTYATGIVKAPLFLEAAAPYVGRVRYLDLGWFHHKPHPEHERRVLTPAVLRPLKHLRPAHSDKRDYGHVLLLGGSRDTPGAILMSTLGALHAGAGLTTTALPVHLASRLASRVPEGMWRSLPVSQDGGLELESIDILRNLTSKASAMVIGPGLFVDRPTQFVISRMIREIHLPMVLDAGVLRSEVLSAVISRPASAGAVVVTPHHGEYLRLLDRTEGHFNEEELRVLCAKHRMTAVLKGPVTYISNGERMTLATGGGPVMARGGSGDILAGMIGTMLAQYPRDGHKAACMAVHWLNEAAEALARSKGQHSVTTTEMLSWLPVVLRQPQA